MPDFTTFSFQGLRIRVEACAPWLLTWLEEFLTPWFAADHGEAADCGIEVVVDADEHRRLLERGPDCERQTVGGFALDGGLVRLPVWSAAGDERLIFDDGSNVFYAVHRDGSHVRFLAERHRPTWRVALMRIVRECALAKAWSSGNLVLHGGAIAVGNQGIAIAGAKGAGKTTLLLQLLQRGVGAAFVSNDRVVIDCDDTVPVLAGMPTVITLYEDLLHRFPLLDGAWRAGRHDHRFATGEPRPPNAGTSGAAIGLSPAQFCAGVGASIRSEASISVLFFPRLSDRDGEITLAEMPAGYAARRLTTLLPGGGPTPLRSEVFGLAVHRAVDIQQATITRRCAALAARLRCFDCDVPRSAPRVDAVVRVLDTVLAPAATAGRPTDG